MKSNTSLELIATLQKAKTQSQINADLKHLEKAVNKLKVIAAFNSSASKKRTECLPGSAIRSACPAKAKSQHRQKISE